MIIGGHGAVGQTISKALNHHSLVIGGRNTEKIQLFINSNLKDAQSRKIDIHTFDESLFHDVHTVIVCVDQNSTELVEYCINNNLNYMDVSANSDYIDKVQKLEFTNKSSILLGVGIAPGVTNILATQLIKENPNLKNVDIHVILGLGEKHGSAAIDWTLDNMIASYTLKNVTYKPLNMRSQFTHHSVKYDTFNFNFADQYLLNNKYPEFNFFTYMGFDKPLATRMIHQLMNLNLSGFLKTKNGYKLTKHALLNPKFGSDYFIIHVSNGMDELVFDGYNEAYYTGQFAAISAVKLVDDSLPFGLIGMDDIVSYNDLSTIQPKMN